MAPYGVQRPERSGTIDVTRDVASMECAGASQSAMDCRNDSPSGWSIAQKAARPGSLVRCVPWNPREPGEYVPTTILTDPGDGEVPSFRPTYALEDPWISGAWPH
jgi:hypothetical protein